MRLVRKTPASWTQTLLVARGAHLFVGVCELQVVVDFHPTRTDTDIKEDARAVLCAVEGVSPSEFLIP